MHLERYEFEMGAEENMYQFFSEGPKGRIKKVVHFSRSSLTSRLTYYLAFGDWDENINWIDDRAVSDNKDRQKILVTVAVIVLTFMEENPNAVVFAIGSTASRTRLYQMGIALFIEQITIRFEVYGFRQGNWELFQRGRNYGSFFIQWKKS